MGKYKAERASGVVGSGVCHILSQGLARRFRLALNSQLSCLDFLTAGIAGVHHFSRVRGLAFDIGES